MKTDIHVHVIGNSKNIEKALSDECIYYNPEDNRKDLARFFNRKIVYGTILNYVNKFLDGRKEQVDISENDYYDVIYKQFACSKELDAMVLLAIDADYHPVVGTLQVNTTDLLVTNRYLFNKIKELNKKLIEDGFSDKRFLLGASINPNRPDWKEEFDFVVNETDAVLMKLIPSCHNVNLRDNKYDDFFECLKRNEIPLLCHVGPQLAFTEGINRMELDDFSRLENPLKKGVKVIAAHCAAPFFPFQKKDVISFCEFMKKWNAEGEIKIWGDTSALVSGYRRTYLKYFVTKYNPDWLVHGSDFPVPVDSWMHLPLLTHNMNLEKYLEIRNESNPFDREIKLKRAHGFHDSIISNSDKILRL